VTEPRAIQAALFESEKVLLAFVLRDSATLLQKNIFPIRLTDFGSECSARQVSALHVEMCMAQHLSLSALCSHWPPPQNAAVRPAEAATCASRSILWAETWVCAAKAPIRCAAERTRTLAGFLTRPMFMRIITGHTLARRCFEPVVGAGPTWTRVPESVRQPAFAAVKDGARPAFPVGGRVRLFRAQISQA
jgi:hypothetical protein